MDLAELKQDLERIVRPSQAAAPEPLVDVLQRLDRAAGSSELDPKLRHYLQKRSYLKALDHLGAAADPGSS